MKYLFFFVAFMTFFGLPMLGLVAGYFVGSLEDRKPKVKSAASSSTAE